MKLGNKFIIGFLMVSYILVLWSCTGDGNTKVIVSPDISSVETVQQEISPRTTMPATFTVQPSFTTTVTPALTATKPISTPTWIALPTLAPTEAMARVLELKETNGGCRFPCWWGITPGETTWNETRYILREFALKNPQIFRTSDRKIFTGGFNFPGLKSNIGLEFLVQNNLIDSIEVSFGEEPYYRISDLINRYGQPSEVWIATYKDDVQGERIFYTILFYPKQGFMASLYNTDVQLIGDKVQNCCYQNWVIALDLWPIEQELSFQQALANSPFINSMFPIKLLQPIEQTTDMSIEQFADVFHAQKPSQCLETPANIWPSNFD